MISYYINIQKYINKDVLFGQKKELSFVQEHSGCCSTGAEGYRALKQP